MLRKQLLGLIVISFIITNVVAFLDEGIRTFDYLTRIGDWIALLIYTVLFLILPMIIFFMIKDKSKRFYGALIGFVPTVFLILPNL